jgi:hypothetical protein
VEYLIGLIISFLVLAGFTYKKLQSKNKQLEVENGVLKNEKELNKIHDNIERTDIATLVDEHNRKSGN